MSLQALDIAFAPATADRYADPANPAAALPIVYGALASPALGGCVPAVEIDRARSIWLVADHPVLAIDAVYVDGERIFTGFTPFADLDLDGLGRIACVEFAAPPGGLVTADVRGRRSAAGALLTDAVDVTQDFLRLAGVGADALDATLLENARRWSKTSGYKLEGVVDRTRTPRDWLAHWMLQVLGDFFVTAEGKLGLQLAGAPLTDFELSAEVRERTVTEIGWVQEAANLLTRPLLRYRFNWAAREFEASDDSPASPASLARFGREFARELELPWARSEAHAGKVRARLTDRLGAPLWTVELADSGGSLLPLGAGDRFTLTHAAAPQAEAFRRVYRILSISKDLETGVVRLLAEDQGGALGIAYRYDGTYLHDAAIRYGANAG